MKLDVRLARPEADASALLNIYAPSVLASPASFEETLPSVEEMAGRIRKGLETYPWLVCEADGRVAGYAYGSRHRERASYRWAVDVSVYVEASLQRRGIGRTLYASLIPLLRRLGYYQAYAGVTLPNPASVGLHESMGFQPFAVYQDVGYKLGRWHDVGWWRLTLRPPADAPADPVPLPELLAREPLLRPT